ncbi:transposase [Acanthocystis turfacea Chlorella virus Canal-1]|nr:transposase [Acanthocystis turfacea Chlorella virus Canal-1]
MLSALIKVQPRKDGSVLDPLAIVPTKEAVKIATKTKAAKQPKAPKVPKTPGGKKVGGAKEQKRPKKTKVVPASDNEDDEANFSEFVPLENVPDSHYEGYVDEDAEADCGIFSRENDGDEIRPDTEWSEFVKEEEERYEEEFETGSVSSQGVESSMSSTVDPDDYGFDSLDVASTDDESFGQFGEDDDFAPLRKKKEKEIKVKTFSGIAIFEDDDWIP